VEDPEQDGRVRGVPGGKVAGIQAQAERHPGQHGLAQAGQRVKVGQHQRAQRSVLETSRPGIFAIGDVRCGSTKRVAAAVGEGAMAIRLAFERARAM
jgi:thioredoxin reductase